MKTKLKYLLVVAIALSSVVSHGSDTETARNEMKKLDFLTGHWTGSGWIRMGPGEPQHFTSIAIIEPRIDGQALVVDGRHTDPEGTPVHHAIGIISWDPEIEKYRFQTYVAGRSANSYIAWLEGDALIWEMEVDNRRMRFTITVDEEGRWHETGVVTIEGKSYPFFEMTLEKTD